MNRPHLEVPKELTSLLLDFTVNVLLEKPADLVDYAVSYFTKLRDEGHSNNQQSVPLTSVTCEDEENSDEDEIDEPLLQFEVCIISILAHLYSKAC
ncbi:hypothetical protein CEXT_260811 [Caerostris extrusa]|uniref:RIIa domain-containing protein n=1 Tax=Caerostris extrusa TaxID=172846 RepID=A0AAV4NCB3_CAEEX|nr:hypothetical protein CEXT_260811 [Caerostris extrusa]